MSDRTDPTHDPAAGPGPELPEDLTERLLGALASGDRQTLEGLAGVPGAAALLRTAQVGRAALAVQPSPATRARQVRELMAEAARLQAGSPPAGRAAAAAAPPAPGSARARGGWGRRIAVTLAALTAAVAVGLPATAALAAGAQPGQALYGTKLAFENAEVALQFSPARKLTLRAKFLDQRLDEISTLVAAGRLGQTGPAADTVAAPERHLVAVAVQLAGRRQAPPGLVRSLESRLVGQAAQLRRQRVASGCALHPRRPACRKLAVAEATTVQVVLRLSRLPGGVPARSLPGATPFPG
jgi:hypothetical protein